MAHGRHRAQRVSKGKWAISLCLMLLAVAGAFTLTHRYVHLTVVHGISMQPTYVTGDLVVSVDTGGYKVGDVITYHPQDLPCNLCNVVHRIVGGNASTGWITRGDNNQNIDPWKPMDGNILGKSVFHLSVPKPLQLLYLPQLWLFILSLMLCTWGWKKFLTLRAEEKAAAKQDAAE